MSGMRSLIIGSSAMVLAFLVLPLLVVVPLSFTDSQFLMFPIPALSTRWYAVVLGSAVWAEAFANSALIALLTTALATTLGTLAAVGITTTRFHGQAIVMAMLVSPLFVPVIVAAVGLFYVYAQLGLSASYAGLVLAHTMLALPFVFLTVLATLSGYDRTLTRAALILGATPLQTFRLVMLPVIRPGVVAGALFAFVTSLDEVVVTLFVGAPSIRMLSREILNGSQENLSPAIAAVATLLILFSAVLMAIVEALRRRGARLRGIAP